MIIGKAITVGQKPTFVALLYSEQELPLNGYTSITGWELVDNSRASTDGEIVTILEAGYYAVSTYPRIAFASSGTTTPTYEVYHNADKVGTSRFYANIGDTVRVRAKNNSNPYRTSIVTTVIVRKVYV